MTNPAPETVSPHISKNPKFQDSGNSFGCFVDFPDMCFPPYLLCNAQLFRDTAKPFLVRFHFLWYCTVDLNALLSYMATIRLSVSLQFRAVLRKSGVALFDVLCYVLQFGLSIAMILSNCCLPTQFYYSFFAMDTFLLLQLHFTICDNF